MRCPCDSYADVILRVLASACPVAGPRVSRKRAPWFAPGAHKDNIMMPTPTVYDYFEVVRSACAAVPIGRYLAPKTLNRARHYSWRTNLGSIGLAARHRRGVGSTGEWSRVHICVACRTHTPCIGFCGWPILVISPAWTDERANDHKRKLSGGGEWCAFVVPVH